MGKTEKELADQIARRLGLPVRVSREYLQLLLEILREDLHKTGQSKLRGLGTLEVHKRKARVAKHPKTGATVEIPERKAVQFRASKTLKDLINPVKVAPKKKAAGGRKRRGKTDGPAGTGEEA